jgi:Domain of unknown function (DUF397)
MVICRLTRAHNSGFLEKNVPGRRSPLGAVVDGRPTDELAWRRGTPCDGGACVEAAALDETVLLRSSRNPDDTTLALSRDEWDAFLVAAKAGHFDAV